MKAIFLFSAAVPFVTAPLLVPSFGGFNPAAFPYPPIDPPVQPAGYAFGIWGLLYLWLLAHACFGLLKRPDHPAWDAPRWPLLVSLGLGAIWLQTAVTMPVVAVVLIWVMTAAAVMALLRTPAGPDHWLLRAPIAAYAGWLTAASGVGTGVVLTGYGIGSPVAVALAMLALILVLAMAVQMRSQAPEYGAAVLWALIAVMVANLTSAPGVAIAALVGAGVVAASLWAAISRNRALALGRLAH